MHFSKKLRERPGSRKAWDINSYRGIQRRLTAHESFNGEARVRMRGEGRSLASDDSPSWNNRKGSAVLAVPKETMMKRFRFVGIFLLPVVLAAFIVSAQAQDIQRKLDIYGYFSTRWEKTFDEPTLQDNQIVEEESAGTWSYPSLNLMMQGQVSNNFRVFLNLNGGGADTLKVQNYWGEYSASRAVNIRAGKIYRKFGLYNEILDAVPTYYGIEPPELFDKDHLIISRTTTLMLHGAVDAGTGILNYSISNDSGEGESQMGAFPTGWDLNYRTGTGSFTFGTSGYASFGPAVSDVGVGDGAPQSGVLPWMAEDDFKVLGVYTEFNKYNLTLQFAYWNADHTALRDPDSTVSMILGGNPNAQQLARFLIDPLAPVTASNINTNGNYDVNTAYVRGGYSIESKIGEWGPYFQWDYYSNPETIGKKKYGGDNEAGVSDNGKFVKWTGG